MGCPPGYRSPDDPTPQEIAERAAAIRACWSEETRLKRCVYPDGVVEVREIAANEVTAPI